MTVLALLLVFVWLAVSAAVMLALSCWALDEDARRRLDTWRAQDQLSPAAPPPPALDREPPVDGMRPIVTLTLIHDDDAVDIQEGDQFVTVGMQINPFEDDL